MSKIKNLENKAMGGSLDKTKLNHNGIKFNNIPNLNTKKPHPMTNRSYEGTLVDYKLCDNTDLPEGNLLRRRDIFFINQLILETRTEFKKNRRTLSDRNFMKLYDNKIS